MGDKLNTVRGTLTQKQRKTGKEKEGDSGQKYVKVAYDLTFAAADQKGEQILKKAALADEVVGVQLYDEDSHATWRKAKGNFNIEINKNGSIAGEIEKIVCPVCRKQVSIHTVHGVKDVVCQSVRYMEVEVKEKNITELQLDGSALKIGLLVQFGTKVWGEVTANNSEQATVTITTEESPPTGRSVMEIYERHHGCSVPAQQAFKPRDARVEFVMHEYTLHGTPGGQKKVYVYPRYIEYISDEMWTTKVKRSANVKGSHIKEVGNKKQRPKHFTFEAEERNKAGRGIGFNDVKIRSLLRPEIKFDIFGHVAVAQKFWDEMDLSTYAEYKTHAKTKTWLPLPTDHTPPPPLKDSSVWKNAARVEAFTKWYLAKDPTLMPRMVDTVSAKGVYPAAVLYPSHDSARDTVLATQARREKATEDRANKEREEERAKAKRQHGFEASLKHLSEGCGIRELTEEEKRECTDKVLAAVQIQDARRELANYKKLATHRRINKNKAKRRKKNAKSFTEDNISRCEQLFDLPLNAMVMRKKLEDLKGYMQAFQAANAPGPVFKEQHRKQFGVTSTQVKRYSRLLQDHSWKYIDIDSEAATSLEPHVRIIKFALAHEEGIGGQRERRVGKRRAAKALSKMKQLCKPLDYFPEINAAVWGDKTPLEWETYLSRHMTKFRKVVHEKLVKHQYKFPKCWAQAPRGSKRRPFRDENALVEHSRSIQGQNLRQFRTGAYMGYYTDHKGSVKYMDASEWKTKANPEYFAAKKRQTDDKKKAKAAKKLKAAKAQQKRQQAARAKRMQRVGKTFASKLRQIQSEAVRSCNEFKKPDRNECKKQMRTAELTSVEEAMEQNMNTQDYWAVLAQDMREAKEDIADTLRVYARMAELNARDDQLAKAKKQRRKKCGVKGLPMAARKACKKEVDAAQSIRDIGEVVARYKRMARDKQLSAWAKKVYKPNKTQKALLKQAQNQRKTAPSKPPRKQRRRKRSKEEIKAAREKKRLKQEEKQRKKQEWNALWASLQSKGWAVEERERKGGSTAGTKDRYWLAPPGSKGKRKKFRSTKEVTKYAKSLAAGGPPHYIIHTEEEQRAIDNPLDFSDSAIAARKRVHARSSSSSSSSLVRSPYQTSGSGSSDDNDDEESDYSGSGEEEEEEDEESGAQCVLGKDEYENRKLFPYQHTLKFLVDATSPINKMLVAWRTGAGKTLGIIQVLETHRFDYRPKVLIFPTKTLEENFYRELLKTKNFYRTHVVKLLKFEIAEKADVKNHQTTRKCEILQHILSGQIGADEIKEARDILEMQQNSWRHGGAKPDPVRTKPNPKSALKMLRRIASRRMHAQALYSTKTGGLSDKGASLFQRVDDALNAMNPVDRLNKILPVEEGEEHARAAMKQYITDLVESLSSYARFGDYLYYLQQNMWPDVLLMRAPLIIMNYTRAGGSQSNVGTDGNYKGTFSWANSRVDAVVRDNYHTTSSGVVRKDSLYQPDWYEFAYLNDAKDHNYERDFHDNPYSSTIAIMDEFHNIMPKYAKRYVDKLERISDLLESAANNVVVGMTATPIVNDAEDAEHLMRVLGKTAMISYFNDLHPALYPCLTNNVKAESCSIDRISSFDAMFGAQTKVPLAGAQADYWKKMLSIFKTKEMYKVVMSSTTALLRDARSNVPTGAAAIRKYGQVQSAKIMIGDKEYKWAKAPKKKVSGGAKKKTKKKTNTKKKTTKPATTWLRERGGKKAREFTDGDLKQATVELRTDKLQRRCQLYCNMSKTNWYNSEKFFQDNWETHYPKLKAVADYILKAPHRVLVLVHQSCGFKAVRATLQHMVEENPDDYTPPCPDPFILEYKEGVLPQNFHAVLQPDLCQGSTRLQLKDLIYYEEDEGDDFDLGGDDSSESESGSDSESDEELLHGGTTPDASDAYNPDDDAHMLASDAILDQQQGNAVDAGEANLAAKEAAKHGATTAKRRKVKLSDEQKAKRDVSTQRNDFNMSAVFKTGWKDKKFKPVTMSRAGGIRTLKEDKVARKKEEEKEKELRRSKRSRKAKKPVSYTDPIARVTTSVAKKGNTIVFEIRDPSYNNNNNTVAKLIYDIVHVEDPEPAQCFSAIYEKECSIAKDNFNEKLHKAGKPFGIKMIVANSAEFGEGVSFKGVREIILMNPALRWSEHKQWIGRALRSCDQPNQPVTITTFVAKGANGVKTADEHAWDKLKANGQALEKALEDVKTKSVEWDKDTKKLLYEKREATTGT